VFFKLLPLQDASKIPRRNKTTVLFDVILSYRSEKKAG